MARKKKDKIENGGQEAKESAGSRLVSFLIALVIIIIWLFVFGLLIKMDIGGFGSNVLAPVLKDVPIVNKILPNSTYSDSQGQKYRNLDEAMTRIKELEDQLASLSSSGAVNADYITELEAENARLKEFENEQKAFNERVARFDEEVVFNDKAPSLEDYIAYYEEIDPDNAAAIYEQAVKQVQTDEKIKEMGEQFAKMDPASAAQILEFMTGDLDLACKILETMKPDVSAAILQEMSVEYAAKVTKRSSVLGQ